MFEQQPLQPRRTGCSASARDAHAVGTGLLAREAVALVASIDLKADEPAVLAAGEFLGVPVRFFPAGRLEAETPLQLGEGRAGIVTRGELGEHGPPG